ncbi:hypothetical protein [Alkaliphilus peptidifermentans]|uniref:Uncharacterized protein n=1 Tax=Alkaliphilus peptidifermentans DSM 18978 TaxID=1120976 RepID=A0A1G5BEN0_9FIRM|nr:hypothetical protein [Alkaliphilus peptidifermentans]SCX88613.1 hypothetical protein SAMN03080606_00392 [Alkaliphilus peptidifermentans DSM 18978]
MIINTLVNSGSKVFLTTNAAIFVANKGVVCPKLNNLLIKEKNHLYS